MYERAPAKPSACTRRGAVLLYLLFQNPLERGLAERRNML
jgi:hypothetical protein